MAKFENPKIRSLRLAVRNLTNKVTGQAKKIAQYNSIMRTLAEAQQTLVAVDETKKLKIQAAYEQLAEGGVFDSTFDQYKVFQNTQLSKKIEDGNKFLIEFGLGRQY